ncbi:sulfotransferase family 2 domain-containing protein [Botrimarina mediterranea]|uniref:Sulfotransferase family protein n=1 Tax=Botrimarina mediterranea TaxID=2528022 RepID=A0A518KET4_9BACT|nr:sulfotransferase family 2 domain-containing protein [Botrimarina mediterranea]QDV76314.1 Sulfotransferase family protein [Botrimarina mediterranea]QDV80912.1 Sulfotransferase family protein [Planctomycetes bacterium K2D]
MILSHSKRFLFFCNPKTGTSSLESVLSHYDESCGEDLASPGLFPHRHAPPEIVRALLPAGHWDSYFKFVFVRDPIDWVVSQFRWNFPPPLTYVKKLYWCPSRVFETVREYGTFRQQIHQRILEAADIHFLHDFLRRFRGIPTYPTLYQSTYAFDINGNKIVDFIGRFERMAEDTTSVYDRLDITSKTPHLNRSFRKPALASLTDAAIDAVHQLWAKDYELLGYERRTIAELRANERR